jgi:uncharacterized protein (DUF2141 family)
MISTTQIARRVVAADRTCRSSSRRALGLSVAGALGLSLALAAGPLAQTRPVEGTGRLEGRVVLGDDNATVRRAIVTISGGELSQSRSVISDDNGAFVFTNLPAGRFLLTAARPAFITSSYGARTPGQPGTRVSLIFGQQVTDVIIRMARGAMISGTVRNGVGEPMPNVTVAVSGSLPLDERAAAGYVDVETDCQNLCGSVITDDRGLYRVFGLPAGSYLIAAFYDVSARIQQVTTAEIDAAFAEAQRTLSRSGTPAPSVVAGPATTPSATSAPPALEYSYAAVFYPGTADPTAAQRVAVAFGEERGGIDIVLAPTPTVTVGGTVISPTGSLPRLVMEMTPHSTAAMPDDLQPNPGLSRAPVTHPAPSGDFLFGRVTPGRYTITARARPGQVVAGPDGQIMRITSDGPAPPDLWASADVVVTGGDLGGVQLTLRPPVRIAGRVEWVGDAVRPQSQATMPVALARAPADLATASDINLAAFTELPVPRAMVQANGTFELTPVYPGLYQITATVPGGMWRLRSAVVAGRDLLDDPLPIGPEDGADVHDVVLTFTDRRTEITGILQTPAGLPATDYYVAVFPTERRWWRPSGRRLAFSRPATDGQFAVRDLPPGEYYIAALTDLDPSSWQTPDFLNRVVPGALRLTVADDAGTRQDLRIAYE